MKNYIIHLLEEIAYYYKALKNKIKGIPPHKYAGLYVIQPIFGGTFLKKTIQDGKENYILRSGHKEAKMFDRKGANIYIRIYKKAGKHHTRFALIKKRVTTLLEEIEKAKEEKKQLEQAEKWSKEQKNLSNQTNPKT